MHVTINCVIVCQTLCVVYIWHPKLLGNVYFLVGHLKAHPLSCLAWSDWFHSRWTPEASSFALLCVSTQLFPNLFLYMLRVWWWFFYFLMSLDDNIIFVPVQVSEEHHCNICGYVDMFITICFLLAVLIFFSFRLEKQFASFCILKYVMASDQCFFFILQWHLSVTLTLQQRRWASS